MQVAVVGASGYTGAELLRLLVGHPHVSVCGVYARANAGKPLASVFPQFSGRSNVPEILEAVSIDKIAAAAEVVFCALPHAASAPIVSALYERGLTVVDLSADFRLRSLNDYETFYGQTHPAPELLTSAVYALPELARARLKDCRLMAAPGCYPTSALLAIAPLLEKGLVKSSGLIIDSKSGASGAGRSPGLGTHLPEVGESVRAYKVGGAHRHTPEIEQELTAIANAPVRVTFTPHLVPISRGIFTCVYAEPNMDGVDFHAALAAHYADEPFVTVLPAGQVPDTAHVRGSNQAHVAAVHDVRAGRVIVMCAIDNLVKGAAGQAVQAMNCARGFPETAGLGAVALFP